MKDIIRISTLGVAIAASMAVAMLMPAKSSRLPAALTPEEISWVEFCKANGYEINDSREDVINEYLDGWVGSTAEEEVLLAHGIKP